MNLRRLTVLLFFILSLSATVATAAEWYDFYDDGLKAARSKDWDTVIEKMNAAIAKKPKEGDKERTYGTTFIKYYPYYYRGVAYLNRNELEKAIADLKQTHGVGDVNLGDPDTLLINANQKLVAQQLRNPTPEQPPVQPPVQPPSQPQQPTVDPALGQAKEAAQRALVTARNRMAEAQKQKAPLHAASDFNQAADLLSSANSLNVSATTTAEFRQVATTADRAARAFDSSITSAQLRIAELSQRNQPPVTPPSRPPVNNTPQRAGEDILKAVKSRLHDALESYFDGRFRDSERQFAQLSLDQSNNAMIWAFLGASRYYDYYLAGQSDPGKLAEAKDALRRAKRLNPNLQLSPDYFSPRLVAFYQDVE